MVMASRRGGVRVHFVGEPDLSKGREKNREREREETRRHAH